MKSLLKGLVLWLCLACAALAEQRVIVVSVPRYGSYENADLTEVNALLAKGWVVVSLSSAASGDTSGFTVFVLESPAPKGTTK